MSQNTVHLWEDVYKFNENEVAFLADWQISLMDPLIDSARNADVTDESEANGQQFTSALPDGVSDVDSALDSIKQLYDLTANLQMTAENIISMHEEVKVKALVLQSLWNGMDSRSKSIEELKDLLKPYVQYMPLARYAFAARKASDIFTSDFQKCLTATTTNLSFFKGKSRAHIDGPLYLEKYKELVQQVSTLAKKVIIDEIDKVTKESSSRLRSFTPNLLQDINTDYTVTINKISKTLECLLRASESHPELMEAETMVGRYYSCRLSLLRLLLSSIDAQVEPATEQRIVLVDTLFLILEHERSLAQSLLRQHFASHESKLLEVIDNTMYAYLKKIRDLTRQSSESLSVVLSYLKNKAPICLNGDQRRLLSLLEDYFGTDDTIAA